MTRNNADFHGVTFSHEIVSGAPDIMAHIDNEEVGRLELRDNGVVHDLNVSPKHRRKGIATGMWKHAQQLYQQGVITVTPKHSSSTTAAGYAWAKTTGDPVPERNPLGAFYDD